MGRLVLVNTPIGNVKDLTPRCLEAFKDGKFFAVEDTRHFMNLLDHLGISHTDKIFKSFHDQSNEAELKNFINELKHSDIYLVSEAGSPVISDPAYPLIRAALEEGFEICSYSGINAVSMALELSGLPPQPFSFHGFFPRDNSSRKKSLQRLVPGTHIFYESPRRIKDSLKIISENLDCDIYVGKELSKTHEKHWRFHSKDFSNIEIDDRGEFVFALNITTIEKYPELVELAKKVLGEKGRKKDLSKLLGVILDRPNKEVYQDLN